MSNSEAVLAQARSRLARMVGPVVLQLPRGRTEMQELAEQLVDGELLTAVEGEGDSLTLLDGYGRAAGIAFRDLPIGQEFPVLIDGILAVSRGGTLLTPLGRQGAADLPEGSALWVLVTPACPRCGHALRLAHEMALESRGRLTVTAIDLTQHPELVDRFQVATVPYFVVGGTTGFPGPLPELLLLQRIADQTAS